MTGRGHWPVDLSRVNGANARAVILLAASVSGWVLVSPKHDADTSWVLVSEQDAARIVVPSNSGLRESVFRSMVKKVLRHSHPVACTVGCNDPMDAWPTHDVVASIAKHAKLDRSHERIMRAAVDEYMPARLRVSPSAPEPVVEQPRPAPPRAEAAAAPATTEGGAPTTRMISEPDEQPVRPRGAPSWLAGDVVRRAPFMAKSDSRGNLYESTTVVELHFADGHVGYGCAWPGCDYRNERFASVARHNGAAHRAGRGREVQPEDSAFDPTVRPFTHDVDDPRRAGRIARLAAELRDALGGDALVVAHQGYDALAVELATRVIAARDAKQVDGDGNPIVAAPLTPEQIIDRIAVLVDRGRTTDLLGQVEALHAELDAERVARAKTLADITALGDIVAAIRGGDEAVAS
jgi:hypothetical protein